MRCDFTNLDLFRTFGNAVPAVMAIDVLKWKVPGITHPTMRLHCEIGGLAYKPISAVVDHGDLIGNFHVVFLVEVPRGLVDEISNEFIFRVGFCKRELDGLLRGERFSPGNAFASILDRFVDAVLGGADARSRLANAIFVEEMLRACQTVAFQMNDGAFGYADIVESYLSVVGGHVERPVEKIDIEPFSVRWDEECGDTVGRASFAGRACEDNVVARTMDTAVESFHTVKYPITSLFECFRFHVGRVAAVVRLGDAKRDSDFSREHVFDHGFLFVVAQVANHEYDGEISDDGRFVLKVVMEA